jgi:hypothetical protein
MLPERVGKSKAAFFAAHERHRGGNVDQETITSEDFLRIVEVFRLLRKWRDEKNERQMSEDDDTQE